MKLRNKLWREKNAVHVRAYRRSLASRYSMLKCAAKRFGLEMTITLQEFECFTAQPCFYCGGLLPEAGYGLDRRCHLKGYTFDNVVPCCASCNERKGYIEGAGFTYPRTVQLLFEVTRAYPPVEIHA